MKKSIEIYKLENGFGVLKIFKDGSGNILGTETEFYDENGNPIEKEEDEDEDE